MALHHRAEAVVEVPHLVAVDVPDLRARPGLEVDRPRVAHLVGGRHAGGERLVGAAVHLARAAGALVKGLLLALGQLLDALAVDLRRGGSFHATHGDSQNGPTPGGLSTPARQSTSLRSIRLMAIRHTTSPNTSRKDRCQRSMSLNPKTASRTSC